MTRHIVDTNIEVVRTGRGPRFASAQRQKPVRRVFVPNCGAYLSPADLAEAKSRKRAIVGRARLLVRA